MSAERKKINLTLESLSSDVIAANNAIAVTDVYALVTNFEIIAPTGTVSLNMSNFTKHGVPKNSTTDSVFESKLIIPLYLIIFVLSVVGNTLVLVTLARNKRMRTVTNVYLLNLAVSDLLLGVFCMPFTLVGQVLRNFIFGSTMCKLIPYFQAVSVSVGVWTLVAISLERYFAICRPLKSRRWQTQFHAYKMIAFVWLASLFWSGPVLVVSKLKAMKRGNVFVIAAILLERNLQNVANYLILSLAVADLLVACLVMPLGAVYEVSQEWTLGPELCDMWTSSDVLCCTASILHLVAIALDRYWAVTNIDYIHQRTSKRIGMMIFIIWLVSFFVCIAPLLGWKDPNWELRLRDKKCLVSQDLYYQIFATASSFYLPLLVILILYWRIFQTARKRIRRRQVITAGTQEAVKNPAAGGIAGGLAAASGTGGIAAAVVTVIGRPLPTISETTTAFTNVSSNNSSPEKTSFANGLEADLPTTTDCSVTYQPQHYPIKRKTRDGMDSKRERKAAKTLAIITGAFVLCWLPFFIMAVILPINANLFEKYLVSICLWLGYFNSTLNPIIYTIFSPEFRHAFKKILCGRNYARRNRHFGVKHFQ